MSNAITPDQITIAITVYSRRDYLPQCISSALNQTVPVKVIVVEDCGPDAGMKDWVLGQFGDRITYFRNPRNRGLFGNWNACMEYCGTPWISILHDDDYLRPDYVASMLELMKAAPDRSFYFCRAATCIDGVEYSSKPFVPAAPWRSIDMESFADVDPVLFPGQLFQVGDARGLGGFKTTSFFTGDWDMWFQLSLLRGNAQTAREVSVMRSHEGFDRGTNKVLRAGRKYALDNVQRKRNLARLKASGRNIPFVREKLLKEMPIPTRFLMAFAHQFPPRILAYNTALFLMSTPPHWRYGVFQTLTRMMGPGFVRFCSRLVRRFNPW